MSETPLNRVPQDWIANIAYAAGDLTIPIASLPGLSAAEADEATGDVGEILRTLLEAMYQHHQAAPVTDRLTNMRITKSSSINAQTGLIQKSYGILFNCEADNLNVVAEPA